MGKSLYKNTMFKLILNIFNIIIPILTGPYIMRVLTNNQVGTLNFAQSIFGYFFMFASFGVYQYGVREISRVKEDKEKLEKTFTSLFSITFVSNIISCLVYIIVINMILPKDEVYMVCMIFTMYFCFNIIQIEWINEALENFDFIAIKSIIVKLIYVVAILIFIKTSEDFKTYIFLIVFNTALGNIISYIYIKKKLKFRFENIKIAKHILPMFIMVILSNANVLYTQLDRIMIGSNLGEVILSYYAVAQGIMIVINTLLMSIVQACAPRLNAYIGSDNKDKYLKLLNSVSKIYFMFLFPISIGMGMLSEELMILYGGNKYIGTGSILLAFAFYIVTIGFDNIIGTQIMYVNRKEKEQVKILFLGGAINLLLNCLLLIFNIFTIEMVVLTTAIANIIVVIIQKIYVRDKLKIDFKIFEFSKLKYLLISIIFIPIIFIIKSIISSLIIRTIASVIICSIFYFIILLIIKDEFMLFGVNKFKKIINR